MKTLTVGSQQTVDTVEMAGFVKKNTTKLVQVLPAGFKSEEYYLVFDVKDQNGNAMEPKADYTSTRYIAFISDNLLLILSIECEGNGVTIVIKGHEYNAIFVNPGSKVAKGGDVNITAIASMTGRMTTKNFVVGTN